MPERIGRYRILGLLGEGGFGVVYQAMQEEPVRRRVALKVLKAGMDSRQVLARFRAEQQALAMMDHPGVARVLDGGVAENGRAYFAMEYVPGLPITDYCDRNRLTTAMRLELLIQVCQAVQHAHQKGVIHRDLKPSNVLVEFADGRPVPKVIDFGVAKAVNRDLTDRTLHTEMGQLIGTPEYMSPEQAEMTGLDIDTRTDIYSLGVLMYELLTGALPFDPRSLRAKGFAEIQRIIRDAEPPNPSTRLSSLMSHGGDAAATARARHSEIRDLIRLLRGDLDWVTMKAMEKDRTRRYESAAQLAEDIRRYLANEPVEARPPSVTYKARKFIRRHRVAIAAAGAAVVLLISALVGLTLLYREAVREKDRADGEMRRANQRTADAQAAQARAQAERDRAEFQAALTNISVADASIAAGDYHSARARLRQVPVALRGWEWRHLAGSVNRSVHRIVVPTGNTVLVMVSDSGRALAACADGSVLMFNLSDGRISRRAPAGGGGFTAAAASPDGRLVVLAQESGAVQVREIESLRTVRELVAPAAVITSYPDAAAARAAGRLEEQRAARVVSVAINGDGTLAALGYANGACRVVDLADGTERCRFEAATLQQQGVRHAAFMADGQRVVTVTDLAAQVWSMRDRAAVGALPAMMVSMQQAMLPAFGVDLDRAGTRLAVLNPIWSQLQVWDTATGRSTITMGTFNTQQDLPGALVRLAPGGESAAIGLASGTIQVWNIRPPESGADAVREPKRLTLTLPGHTGRLCALEFSPDRSHLVSAGTDGTVRIWSPVRNRPSRAIPRSGAGGVQFSNDSRLINYSTDQGPVFADALTGAVVPPPAAGEVVFGSEPELHLAHAGDTSSVSSARQVLAGVPEIVWRTALHSLERRERLLVEVTDDRRIEARVLDANDGSYSPLKRPVGAAPLARRLSPLLACRGRHGAIAVGANSVEIYDLTTGDFVREVALPKGFSGGPAAFGSDVLFAVATENPPALHLLPVDGSAAPRVAPLAGAAVAVAFSPDHSRIAVALQDGSVRLLEATTLAEVIVMRSSQAAPCQRLAFSPCGTMLAGGGESHVQIWYARRENEAPE